MTGCSQAEIKEAPLEQILTDRERPYYEHRIAA